MAKEHWYHDKTGMRFGCQHSTCTSPAFTQWQRAATAAEIAAEHHLQGPYGDVIRNPEGPHHIAVFGCQEHALPMDRAALRHAADCPAPDDGCVCRSEG